MVGVLVAAGAGATDQSVAMRIHRDALPPVPPAPNVAATRADSRVRITYLFSVWPNDLNRRPVMLLTAVQSSGTRYTPYAQRHAISKQRGVVWQPLGLGKAPFKLFAAAYSRLGRSSVTVTVRVRG